MTQPPLPLDAAAGTTVPTGFPSVDGVLGGGVRRGDLVVIGGEAGSGKSALALSMAIRASGAGQQSLFYTGEMTAPRALERAIAMSAKVRVDDLRRDTLDEVARALVSSTAFQLVERGPDIDELPRVGIDEIAERLDHDTDATSLIVIDPLESLAYGVRALQEEIASAVLALKRLAVTHDVAVIATSHIAPMATDRIDRRPRLHDFGGLGGVAQHADVVFGLFREEMFDANRGIEGATELHVLKNRNGPLGYVDLFFYKQWVRFEDVMEPE
jgi:replicative DNA helicase